MGVDAALSEEDLPHILSDQKHERISSPRPLTPPLPLSPISNPSTPPRKRQRTSGWNPPSHIPDFLPPFPSSTPRPSPSPPPISLPSAVLSVPAAAPKIDRLPTPPPELGSTSSADYRTSVPYSMSVLASQPLSHLPSRPLSSPPPPPPQPVPEIQPSLYQAYHYALTHPPSKELGLTNPARYKVAVSLIEQTEMNPRWEPVPSLYGISISNAPRVNSAGPTYPIPLQDEKTGNGKGKEVEEPKLPAIPQRPIITTERAAPLISQQASRMHSLSKKILPVSSHNYQSTFLSQAIPYSSQYIAAQSGLLTHHPSYKTDVDLRMVPVSTHRGTRAHSQRPPRLLQTASRGREIRTAKMLLLRNPCLTQSCTRHGTGSTRAIAIPCAAPVRGACSWRDR